MWPNHGLILTKSPNLGSDYVKVVGCKRLSGLRLLMTTNSEWYKSKHMQCQPPKTASCTKLGPAAAGADAVVQKGSGGCSRLGTQAPRAFNMQKKAAMNYGITTAMIPMGLGSGLGLAPQNKL